MSTMFSKVMLLGRMQCRLSLHCMVMLRPVKREEQLLLVFNLTSDHLCSPLRYIINLGHPIDHSISKVLLCGLVLLKGMFCYGIRGIIGLQFSCSHVDFLSEEGLEGKKLSDFVTDYVIDCCA